MDFKNLPRFAIFKFEDGVFDVGPVEQIVVYKGTQFDFSTMYKLRWRPKKNDPVVSRCAEVLMVSGKL